MNGADSRWVDSYLGDDEFLSVYVDDFKLVGRKDRLAKGWRLMTDAGLRLGPPEPLGE